MKLKRLLCLSLLLLHFTPLFAQQKADVLFTEKEHTPDHISPLHKWNNLIHYSISIEPDYHRKFIKGTNKLTFKAIDTGRSINISLQEPMSITGVTWKNVTLDFTKVKDEYYINFPVVISKGKTETIAINFEGQPRIAKNPPFDNGWIFTTDKSGRPWMSVACQGSGASIWLPCKEVLYDEPDDGVSFSITVPDTLTAVANGRLQHQKNNNDGSSTFTWQVSSPINNYNIIPYIGKYETWHNNFKGKKGNLDCDYWVLDYNITKAKQHLKQADTMLRSFEDWLGPYPFYKDSYKLVEAPMPGMEHQSAIAYGNRFENGYSGKNLSGTKWGLLWDFILIHESGHEWFGNSITTSNHSDSWIHEGFTKYLETIYTGYAFGVEAGNEYAIGTWNRIKNDRPVIGGSSSDKYYKPNAMLHMIRQIIGDKIFKQWLQALNRELFHHTVTTQHILRLLNRETGRDFSNVFKQYLETVQVPELQYRTGENKIEYRWSNCTDNFDMPVKVLINGSGHRLLYPTTTWQQLDVSNTTPNLTADPNFYITTKNIGAKN